MKMRILVKVRCPHCLVAPADTERFRVAVERGQKVIACDRCGRVHAVNAWLEPETGPAAAANETVVG